MNTATRFALGAAGGAVAALVLPRGEDSRVPAAPLDLEPGRRAVVVTGSSMAPWALATLGAATGVTASRAFASRSPGDTAGALVVAATTAALRRVGVLVDPSGVTVTCGIPGLRRTIPLSAIASARPVTVTAADFGGYGLRLSLERGVGLVLRPGPALALDLGRWTLTITADDPDTAAALISRELDVRGGTRR